MPQKFVFQCSSLWPDPGSGILVEGAELQGVLWSHDACFVCAVKGRVTGRCDTDVLTVGGVPCVMVCW